MAVRALMELAKRVIKLKFKRYPDIQELVSISNLVIAERLSEFNDPGFADTSKKNYIIVCCLNACRSYIRREYTHTKLTPNGAKRIESFGIIEEIDYYEPPIPFSPIIKKLISTMCEHLTPKQQLILRKYFWHKDTLLEIGGTLGIVKTGVLRHRDIALSEMKNLINSHNIQTAGLRSLRIPAKETNGQSS